jgi:hypothetical protein
LAIAGLNPLRGFVFGHLQDRAGQDTVGEPELIQNRIVIRVGDRNQIARKMGLRPVGMVITAASDHRRQLTRAVRNGKRLVDGRPAHWRQGFNLHLGQLDLVVDMGGVAKGSEIENARDGHPRRHLRMIQYERREMPAGRPARHYDRPVIPCSALFALSQSNAVRTSLVSCSIRVSATVPIARRRPAQGSSRSWVLRAAPFASADAPCSTQRRRRMAGMPCAIPVRSAAAWCSGGVVGKDSSFTIYAGTPDDPSSFHLRPQPSGLGGHPAGAHDLRRDAALSRGCRRSS